MNDAKTKKRAKVRDSKTGRYADAEAAVTRPNETTSETDCENCTKLKFALLEVLENFTPHTAEQHTAALAAYKAMGVEFFGGGRKSDKRD